MANSIYTIEHNGQRFKVEAETPEAALSAVEGQGAPSPSFKDTAYDVAASIPAGFGEGVAGTFGALGNVRNAVSHGADYLASRAGIDSDKLKGIAGGIAGVVAPGLTAATRFAPTSEQIQKGFESFTGEFHKPTTTAGEYARAGAEAVPAALLGPEGLGLKVAMGIGSGLGGEFLANKFAGTSFEPFARLIGGIVGGGGVAGGTKTVESARNYAAARNTGQAIGDVLGTGAVKPGAVRRAAQSAADDELTLSGVQATRAQLGPEAMLMDMGRQMQGRAEAIALPPGRAQNTVLDAVEGRTGEFGSGARSRIEDTLNQHLGPTRDVVRLRDEVHGIVQDYAKPAYDRVMQNYPLVMDDTLAELANRPAIAQAMSRARGVAANYGETIEGATPSLRYWDYVKKSLDQRINGMMKSGMDDLSSAEKADLGGLLNAKQALVQHLDDVTGGQYATARKIAASKPELDEALDFGRSIFNSRLLPEEVAAQIDDLSIPAQAMAQVGARREIARVLDAARNDGAKARAFLDTNNNRAKIANLFGEDVARAIENRVSAENTFQEATQNIARNSRTATRQELIKDTETPSPGRIDATLIGMLMKGGKAGLGYAMRHGMENTREGIANIVTARGAQIDPIVEQLLGYNAKRTANAASPMNEQTAALVRALLINSNPTRENRP